jgi:CTP:molybdopterin cytidylyltransferase MocA
MIQAAVLAAGLCEGGFAESSGVRHKCMVEVAGRPMLAWVLDALRGTRTIHRFAVVGPPGPLRESGARDDEILPLDDGRFADSVHAAVEVLEAEERALILAGDMPLLTAAALERYIETCIALPADLCFPVIRFEDLHTRFPDARKTWYRLRDGTFTKGNAIIARPAFLRQREARVQRLFEHRKQRQWTGLIGPAFAERLARRALTLRDMQQGLSWYLRGRLRAVPADPEIIIDVDEPEDVEHARRALEGARACEDRVLH